MKPQDLTVAQQTLLKQFPLLRLSSRERGGCSSRRAFQKGRSAWRVSVDPPSASAFTAIFAQVICLLLFQAFPPIRSPFCVKLSWGLNHPSPLGLEELHANRKAFALQ